MFLKISLLLAFLGLRPLQEKKGLNIFLKLKKQSLKEENKFKKKKKFKIIPNKVSKNIKKYQKL